MAAEQDALVRHANLEFDRLAGDLPALGIALSGGGDSTALMHLARLWGGARLQAATVDHGLRAGSAAEAHQAGLAAGALGIPHETLHWHREGGGNLMAAAREARLRLLSDWALRHGLSAVLLGHTQDDQAETLLMRLSRGAGIDGLSGMAGRRLSHGMLWLRPLLGVTRADLRDWLAAQRIGWSDDPSNDRADFHRIRIRKAMAELGIPAPQLAQTAENLAMAREALGHYAAKAAEGATLHAGVLTLPAAAFAAAPAEIRRRLFVAGLRWVSGSGYPPRREAVRHALAELAQGRQVVLDGVIATPGAEGLGLVREPAASLRAAPASGDPALWDGRWRITGLQPGQQVRALGHDPLPGLGWRDSGLGRDQAATSPGIWRDGVLIGAPVLHPMPGLGVEALRGLSEFHAMLYVH